MTNLKHITTLNLPEFRRFAVGFDNLFDQLESTFELNQSAGGYPPHNVISTGENTFVIELAVAGFGESDLNVSINGNKLTVTGSIVKKEGEAEVNYLHRGISARKFVKEFPLADHVVVKDATVVNGLLRINLERIVPEELKPRSIPITFSK